MQEIGEVRDAKSIDDLITFASITGKPMLDFENLDYFKICMRTLENPDREHIETIHHSRRKSSTLTGR